TAVRSERKSNASAGSSFKRLNDSTRPSRRMTMTSSPRAVCASSTASPSIRRIASSCGISSAISVEIERALLPCVNEADHDDQQKNPHLDQPENAEPAKRYRPRVQEHHFQIEDEEQHRDEIKVHREADARVALRRIAGLERVRFDGRHPLRADRLRDKKQRQHHDSRKREKHQYREKRIRHQIPCRKRPSHRTEIRVV